MIKEKSKKQKTKQKIELLSSSLRRFSIVNLVAATVILVAQLAITIIGCISYPTLAKAEPTGQELTLAAYNIFFLILIEIIFSILALIIFIGVKNARPIKKPGNFFNSLMSLFFLWILTSIEVVLLINLAPKGPGVVNATNIIISVLEIICFILSIFWVKKKAINAELLKFIKKTAIGIVLINVLVPLLFFLYAFLVVVSYSS